VKAIVTGSVAIVVAIALGILKSKNLLAMSPEQAAILGGVLVIGGVRQLASAWASRGADRGGSPVRPVEKPRD
jgi:hypothetical protein